MKRRYENLGLGDNVSLVGHREDVGRFLVEADVFVFSSYYEGFGTAVVEAMAAGLPVVAFPNGPAEEIVVDGETGILVEDGTPAAMAEAISKIIGDPELGKQMGCKGERRASLMFDSNSVADQMARVFVSVLGKRGRAA